MINIRKSAITLDIVIAKNRDTKLLNSCLLFNYFYGTNKLKELMASKNEEVILSKKYL
jgi:hypothetical protein